MLKWKICLYNHVNYAWVFVTGEKVCIQAKLIIWPVFISGFSSMKQLQYRNISSLPDGMLLYHIHGYPQHSIIKFVLYPGELSAMPKHTTQCRCRLGLKRRLLDLEASTLTMMPPFIPGFCYSQT